MIIDRQTIIELEEGKINNKILATLKSYFYENLKKSKYDEADNYYYNKENILNKNRILSGSANNIILSNYARYITELNVGYFMGKEISYNVEGKSIQEIIDLYRKNTIVDIDKKNAKNMSKYGKCYEITYLNENSEIKTKALSPKDAMLFYDESLDETPVAGMYIADLGNTGTQKNGYKIYIYTANKIISFKADNEFKTPESIDISDNTLGILTMLEIKNNDECIGDFENVKTLIDAYNKVVSNDIDNIEEFIDSILLIYGDTGLTQEQMKLLRETRGLELDKDARAEYLTKVLDETGISIVLERIRKDIHKFSFTPDMSDEQFSGNSSGVAIQYKLLPFELLAQTKESQYKEALKKRFEIYSKYAYIAKNIAIVPVEEVEIVFKRALPKNDSETAQMITQLQGMVANKTLISNLSFIQDPNEEEELIQEQEKQRNKKLEESIINTGNYHIGKEEIEEVDEVNE